MINIQSKLKNKIIFLAFFPLVYFLTYWAIGNLRGPFYLNPNNDPSYAYLGNAINVAILQTPNHTDHPGTPVQILGSLILRILFQLRSSFHLTSHPFVEDVLSNSEFYLRCFSVSLLGIGSLALFALGFITFNVSQDLVLSLILQVNSIFIYTLARVQFFPEALQFSIVQALVVLAVLFLYKNEINQRAWFLFALGILLGLGIAVKVTFLPMLTFILLAPGIIRKALVCLVIFSSAIVFTIPIISQYPRLFSWLTGIATRQGGYGSGSPGIAPGIVGYFVALFHQEPIFFSLFYFATFLCLLVNLFLILNKTNLFERFSGISHRLRQQKSRKILTVITIVVLVFLGQCGLVLFERVGMIRYFMPSMALFQLLVFSLFIFVTNLFQTSFRSKLILKALVLALCIFISIPSAVGASERFSQDFSILNSEVERIEDIQSGPIYRECVVVQATGVNRPSTTSTALEFLNLWAGNRFNNELMELNPDYLGLNPSDASFVFHFGERKELASILEENQCVLLRYSFNAYSTDFSRTPSQTPPAIEGVELREIFHGRLEALDQIVLSR